MCFAAALQRIEKEVQKVKDAERLWFDATTLGFTSPQQYEMFLLELHDGPTLKKVREFLPLSYPAFNFVIDDNNQWNTSDSPTITTGRGSKSIFTDHIIPLYFRKRPYQDNDRRRDRTADRWLWHKWQQADAAVKRKAAINAIPSADGRHIDGRSTEARVNQAFDFVVGGPTASILRPVIPGVMYMPQLAGYNCRSFTDTDNDSTPLNYARSLLVYALAVPNSGFLKPLVVCEGKTVPIDRLTDCLEWGFYNQFGCGHPVIEEPSQNEIDRCVEIMRQGFGYCFAFANDRIVIHDALCMHVIKFDLANIKVYSSDYLAAREFGKGPKFDSIGARVAVVDYSCKTIRWDSCDPPMRKELAMMAIEEYTLDDVERRKRIHALLEAKEMLWETDDFVVNVIYEHRKIQEAEERKERGDIDWDPSSATGNVGNLSFSILQDGAYINRVVRMSMEECSRILPSVKSDCKEVVVKMLDFFNVEMYYHSVSKIDVGCLSMDDFKQHCVRGYANEVDSYLRMAKYASHKTMRLLHTPKMLDYGSCCIHDDKGRILEGYYLVLEYIDGIKDLPSEEEMHDTVTALGTMGIVHRDMVERNWIRSGDTKFLIDFNHVKLLKVGPQVAVGS